MERERDERGGSSLTQKFENNDINGNQYMKQLRASCKELINYKQRGGKKSLNIKELKRCLSATAREEGKV